jgi:hypothetical protein
MTALGIQTSGTVQGNFVNALTQLTTPFLEVGTGGITSNAPNTPFAIGAQGITTSPTCLQLGLSGTPVSGKGMVGFGSSIPTQTTVGAAGSASVIPGAPKKWIQFTDTDGSVIVIPVWAAS